MSEVAEVTDATEVMAEASTTRPALDPIMVASCVEDTWAIWQVETDPEVQLGDFSGAWIIGPEGIQGFAAEADWIEGRDDQQVMLQTVIRYPVVPVDRHTHKALVAAFDVSGASGKERDAERETPNTTGSAQTKDQAHTAEPHIVLVDWEVIEGNAAEAIAQAKKDFSAEFEGKKQPAWGSITPLENTLKDIELGSPIEGLPGGAQGNAAKAAGNALVHARGLRAWIRQWNTFDKLRVRRLGPVLSKHEKVTGLPLI